MAMVKRIMCLAVIAGLGFGASGGTTIYVDRNTAGEAEPYATGESASATIATALTYAATLGDEAYPVEIVIAPGTYAETGFTLGKAITVRGATGDPADVIINDDVSGSRAFEITHADVVIRDLTITGRGWHNTHPSSAVGSAGHVLMSAGLIENCVIRDGYACAARLSGNWSKGKGGNVYMSGGRLVRCQILNGHLSDSGDRSNTGEYGGGIYAEGASVIDSCLVQDNNPGATLLGYGGGIYAKGSAVIVNCTIAGNKVNSNAAGGGIYADSSSVKVVNCVLINNGGTTVTEFGDRNPGRYFCCASTVTNTSCATWMTVTADDFVNAWSGDYRLQPTSKIIDAGSTDPSWYPSGTAELDVEGNSRISGTALDLGCYEVDQSKLSVGGYLSAYVGFEGGTIRFTANTKGGTGPIAYRWDFGNGVTNETTDTAIDYVYPGCGLFVVRVAARDDNGIWTDWFEIPQHVVVMPETMYVDGESANPVFPYKTRETAATRIATVLQALTNNVSAGKPVLDGTTIRICKGTLVESGIQLPCGITIRGDTGDPADVIINDNTVGKRAFTITHPDVVIRDLTITGQGFRQGDPNTAQREGGHINMSAGRVENCVIRDGYACGNRVQTSYSRGRGGNVYMTGGRLVRCQILNGHMSNNGSAISGADEFGGGVYAEGTAVVDSCLIKDNNPGATARGWGGGICADGSATVVNCTIGGNGMNANTSGAGVYVKSATAKVVNCVMINNGGTAATEFGSLNQGRYFTCASTVPNTSCATWMTVTEDDFISVSTGDYRLQPTSILVDSGSTDAAWYPTDTAVLDIEGNPRVSGTALDLGCYEVDQSKINIGGTLSSYGGLEGASIHFTASAKGGSGGDYIYRWDFGNGVTNETADAEFDYAYPASGLFTVRVAAKEEGGEWTDWTVLAQNVVVMPEVTYVDGASANPVFPYKTRETAATGISTVIQAMTNNVSAGKACIAGVTIRICKGTLAESGVLLPCGIAIRGDTGDPADVIINDNTVGKRAFTITHPDVVIRDLTITGQGFRQGDPNTAQREGGHINMSAGLVENCVIRDGYACGNRVQTSYSRGRGGNVYMTGGRLVRCQILNGHMSNNGSNNSGADEFGGGVYAAGSAIVDSCLIKDNNPGATARGWGGGICADGSATVVNCTIGGNGVNANTSGAGVYVKSATAKVVNCVMINNGGTAATEFGDQNPGRYFTCASSVTNTGCATWMLVTDDDFISVSTGDYRLQPTSALVDAGSVDPAWYPELTAVLDLDGNPRFTGTALDLGCYEVNQSKINIGGTLSSYGGLEGASIHFTASAKGGSGGDYIYRWDFGNGVTNETTDAEFDYAYPAGGLFTVRVAAKEEGGDWTDWVTLGQNVAVMPETMYVDGASLNPVFPYRTRETAATRIVTVLQAMTNNVSDGKACIDGVTIRICKGTLAESGVLLPCGVTVRGDTGDPADVIINDNTVGRRAFQLTHPGAAVKDLTINGSGYHQSENAEIKGGHVLMSAGLVENCVIRDGYAFAGRIGGPYSWGNGGNVYMTGGRLVRCQILNGHLSNSGCGAWRIECGGGVFAGGTAVVDTCLIKDNNPGATDRGWGGGVYADGSAAIVNCTIIGNKVTASTDPDLKASGGGIYVASESVKVVNCVMFDNGGTAATEFGDANLGCFVRCASSTNNEVCATWQVIGESAFRSWTARATGLKALRPAFGRPLVGTGTDAEGYEEAGGAATIDLLGKPRVFGRRIDIGCLESQADGSVLKVR